MVKMLPGVLISIVKRGILMVVIVKVVIQEQDVKNFVIPFPLPLRVVIVMICVNLLVIVVPMRANSADMIVEKGKLYLEMICVNL